MSAFWSLWIIVLTLGCLALTCWVLFANRKVAIKDDVEPENNKKSHVYDGIEEYDNPLPRWWFNLFVGTLIFAAIYLVLYPGLGAFGGVLGWTSIKQLEQEQENAQASYADSFEKYNSMSVAELVEEPKAMKMGVRLFANNCAVCHGSDGGGNYGYPNLTDKDWLYGGSPADIKATLVNGRAGAMPGFSAILGKAQIENVADFVLGLSGQEHNKANAVAGRKVFMDNCSACHGADGKGNHVLGAPNLTDDIWLYEGTKKGIMHGVSVGRANVMPAQQDKLREEKIHLLTAYVYSLSLDD